MLPMFTAQHFTMACAVCAGMESCNCHEWKIAVGVLSFCLISVIALVGVTGAAVGCKKCCKKRNTRRSGRMHARCMNEVGYYNGNYSKFFVVLGHDAHACRPVLCFMAVWLLCVRV